MSSLQFQYPWLLTLLWLAPAGGVLWHVLTTRRSAGRSLVSPRMAALLAPAPAPARQAWQLVLLVTGLFFGLIAAARPQWGSREEIVYQRGRDLLLMLDVSRSMLATDVHPSRLGRAKVDLLDLIKQLRGDRVALLAFRGKPVLLCPFTSDYGFLAQVLEGTDVDSAPAGETDIGAAVQEAMKTFEGDETAHRAMILVSDGDDLAGRIDPAAAEARDKGIPIFTVGFGSSAGASVPSPADGKQPLSYQGQAVVSRLNNELMRALAEKTGGAYVPVGLANVKLGDLYRDHLSRISARDQEESVERQAVERYQYFLFVAIVCFLAAAFLSRGQIAFRRPERPTWRPADGPSAPESSPALKDLNVPPAPLKQLGLLLLLAAAWAAPRPAPAATNAVPAAGTTGTPTRAASAPTLPAGREGARQAQKLYLQGKYKEAALAYRKAAATAARAASADYLFNAGCAFYKAGEFEQAADVFRSLDGAEGRLGADAAYNLGCAFFERAAADTPGEAQAPDPAHLEARVESLKRAAAAFQKTLRLAPDDDNGRRNLGVVAGMMDAATEQAKIARLMAQYGQTPPGAVADQMLLQQRKLLAAMPGAFSNATPKRIEQLEALAAEQDQTADLMIPLKGKLLQAMAQGQASGAVTNAQQQIAQLNGFAESIRDRMYGVSEALRDLDPKAYAEAAEAEAAAYTLWKGVAAYEQLLREDLLRQTNAIARTDDSRRHAAAGQAARAEQEEALDLTGLFAQRFEQAVPPEGLSRPSPPAAATNAPAGSTNAVEQLITPETRQKILDLARACSATQQFASAAIATNPATALPAQREAYRLLEEIRKLLPRNEPPQPQEQPQQEQQEQRPQPQQEQPKEQTPKESPRQQEPKKGELSPEEVKRMLDKAMQREKEHEQEKRERDSYVPMSPSERDW